MTETEKINKIKFLLIQHYDQEGYDFLAEILKATELKIVQREELGVKLLDYNMEGKVQAAVFLNNANNLDSIQTAIKSSFQKFSDYKIRELKLIPDYHSFEISHAEIQPIVTKWTIINDYQSKLINQLNSATSYIEFQNIGNTARHAMKELASLIYVHEKHKPEDTNVEINDSTYGNKIHSYILSELKGKSNKDLREFTSSTIEMAENAIKLANNLAHKKNAPKVYAEGCIIAVLAVINVIKSIET